MAKVVMICGKICCGKSTYAHQLRIQHKAVILSADEIMLALLPPYLGDEHEKYVQKAENYLLAKAVELVETGIDVILDWGFWSKADREKTKAFFAGKNIDCRLHYLAVSDSEWQARLAKRNSAVAAGDPGAYFVDENLAKKCLARFETPQPEEVDLWIKR